LIEFSTFPVRTTGGLLAIAGLAYLEICPRLRSATGNWHRTQQIGTPTWANRVVVMIAVDFKMLVLRYTPFLDIDRVLIIIPNISALLPEASSKVQSTGK